MDTSALVIFLERICITPSGCWMWLGNRVRNGYGRFRHSYAHRIAFEQWRGPIPASREIDHLCRNKGCVNPDHLDLVTRSENNRRGLLGVLRQQTHCKMGHHFDAANTHIDSKGHRTCRACHNEAARRYIEEHREYYAAKRREYYQRNIEVERAKAREYQRNRRKQDA